MIREVAARWRVACQSGNHLELELAALYLKELTKRYIKELINLDLGRLGGILGKAQVDGVSEM